MIQDCEVKPLDAPIVLRQSYTQRLGRYVAIACISVASLAVVLTTLGMPVTYFAAGLLIFAAKERYDLALWSLVLLALGWTARAKIALWLPYTCDATLWRIDTRLGFDPQLAMHAFDAMPVLRGIANCVYFGLPTAIALTCAVSKDASRFFVKQAVTTGIVFLLYLTFPACGPYYLLTSTAGASRNAMPSMHTTWALMIWREMRAHSLAARLASDLFLLFTVIATLGSGEHYLVDLLAAVPFWMVMEWLLD